jgi:hypothetical protein
MPDHLNAAIELHDSVVGSLAHVGQVVQLALRPAYMHKSVAEPGVDDGIGVVQNVILEFDGGQIEGNIEDLPADIFDGDLQVGSQIFDNMIPLPSEVAETVRLTLFISPDNRKLSVSGQGLKVIMEGEAVYVEEFRR